MTQLDREAWADLLQPLSVYLQVQTGAVAEDRESGRRVLVVEHADESANEFVIESIEMTVAEANTEWPHDDDVYGCVFLNDLPDSARCRSPVTVVLDCRRSDLPTYHFPKERLRAVAPDSVSIRDFEERGGA